MYKQLFSFPQNTVIWLEKKGFLVETHFKTHTGLTDAAFMIRFYLQSDHL